MNIRTTQPNTQSGFIALISAVIISVILLEFTAAMGSNSFHSRFDALNGEFKRISLGLAESCVNVSLLKISKDYDYHPGGGGEVVLVGYDSNGDPEYCKIKSVTYSAEDPITHQKIASITTDAEYRGTWSSVSTNATVRNPSIVANRAVLFTVVQFVNNNGGSLGASSSTITISGASPSPDAMFNGSELGTISTIDANTPYSVSGNTKSGYYPPTGDPGCSSSTGLSPGATVTCVITYDDKKTTGQISVIANIINDDGGSTSLSNFHLYINGTQVSNGIPKTLSPGTYDVTGGTVSGYSIKSKNGYCDSVSLNAGDDKTCTITYDDNPPPSPICADTIMMLDRTGSMTATDLTAESTAANALLDLYNNLDPAPKVAVGVFGAVGASEPYPATIMQGLTSAYAGLRTVISTGLASSGGGTNLESAIKKAQAEFNANGSHHADGSPYEHALILLSDGGTNRPTSSTTNDTGFLAPTLDIQNGSGDTWANGMSAYADGGTDTSDPASENNRHQFYNFNLPTIPIDASINGIEVKADAWVTGSGGTTSTFITDNFGIGNSNSDVPNWNENGSTTGTQAQAPISTGDNSASADGGRFALIEGSGGWICRTIDATNKSTLSINYYWHGDTDAESSDQGLVEYNTNGNCSTSSGWSSVVTHALNSTSWSTLQTANLPSSLNNDNSFAIRFRSNSSSTNESLRVDGFKMNGTSSPLLACQLGMSLSWDGGNSWTSSGTNATKTQTLSGTETQYTFGSATDDWTGSHTWTINEFSNSNFRVRVHAIDPGTNCDDTSVEHLDFLQSKIYYSVTTDPYEAAHTAADAAKLAGTEIFTIHFGSAGADGSDAGSTGDDQDYLARLASGTVTNSPHENGSFNDPNGVVTNNSNFISPTSQYIDTGGDANGFETNPGDALADGGGSAQNIDGVGDRHVFSGYNFVIPPGANVTGIQVRPDWYTDVTSGNNSISIELSWNGGASWTSAQNQSSESTNDTNNKLVPSNTTNIWGHAWLPSEFLNDNFRVRITSNCSNSSTCTNRDFYLDWAPIRIYYTVIAENGDNDHFFISPTAGDMKGIFNYIGAQLCPYAANPPESINPTTAKIIVVTNTVNDNLGTLDASDFTMNVSATNPSLTTFSGEDSPGVEVVVEPGSYNITEGDVAGYTKMVGAGCSGTIPAGETRTCVITNDDLPPPPPPPPTPPPNIDIGAWEELP